MEGEGPGWTPPRPLGAHNDLTHPGGPVARPRRRRPRREGGGVGAAVALGLVLAGLTFVVHFALWFGSCVTGCVGQGLGWLFLAWLAPASYVALVASGRSSAGWAALVGFGVLAAFVAAVLLM